MKNFHQHFMHAYLRNLKKKRGEFHTSFGMQPNKSMLDIVRLEQRLSKLAQNLNNGHHCATLIPNHNYFMDNIDDFEDTYNWLNDDFSKQRFIEFLAYKAIGSLGIDIDIAHHKYEEAVEEADKCLVKAERFGDFTNIGNLAEYDLTSLGYNANLIHSSLGIAIDFIAEQYAYQDIFGTQEGDIVIDCGGATGDTFVYFAAKGASKVYVFEFIETNLKMLEKQLEINPHLQGKIKRIDSPVWDVSDIELSYLEKGNSSRVAEAGVYPNSVKTFAIDDLEDAYNCDKVDLIKMDIEGAELPALKGAQKVIRKHKPKLAICVYHKPDDLVKIPRYIKSLNPDYELYFECYTDVGWEAVIYALDKNA